MIAVVVSCDYPRCWVKSEPVKTRDIDRYEYHDAPSDAVCFEPPPDWYHDLLYGFIACLDHAQEMCSDRQKWATR
jgi:hypothetical protein